jgi:hypothetical protein
MLAVHPTFKLDVLKMEHAFQMGCQEGEKPSMSHLQMERSTNNGKERKKG